jgi:hypothetical protein
MAICQDDYQCSKYVILNRMSHVLAEPLCHIGTKQLDYQMYGLILPKYAVSLECDSGYQGKDGHKYIKEGHSGP